MTEHPEFNPPSTHDVGGIDHPGSCTCEYEDDGDPENGPHLSITYDESCPRHGRKAEPELWRDPFASEQEPETGPRYMVRRFYFDSSHPHHGDVVLSGLTLAEAQAHCQDPATCERDGHGHVKWFDGYDKEVAR